MKSRLAALVASAALAAAALTFWPIQPSRVPAAAAQAAPAGDAAKAFLTAYCTECHGAEKQKGERRFDQLQFPLGDADALTNGARPWPTSRVPLPTPKPDSRARAGRPFFAASTAANTSIPSATCLA
jgi:mono/diheme cytochrome c family protein